MLLFILSLSATLPASTLMCTNHPQRSRGPWSEQGRKESVPWDGRRGREDDTRSATHSHFLVLLQQQSRKVAQLDDEYCKLLILLIIPEMKRGHTEHLLVTHLSLSPLIIMDGAATALGPW